MSVRLEPVDLANVQLFVLETDTLKAFPFISMTCHESMQPSK